MSAFEVDGKAIEQVLQVTLNLLDECSWPLRGINCLAKLYDISHEDDGEKYDNHARELLSWLGNEWHAENIRSVNYRYNENRPVVSIAFNFDASHMNAWGWMHACLGDEKLRRMKAIAQAVKTLDSLAYQSCETRGYFSTWQYKALDGIRSALCLAFVKCTPEYENARWC